MCMICKFAYQCHIGLLKSCRYFMTYRDMISLHLTSAQVSIWNDWIRQLDAAMRLKERNILLLVDNAPSHNASNDSQLSNIVVQYLPPNTTSCIQPLDAGIIRSFKSKYKRHYCRRVLEQVENNIDPER